MNKPDSIYIKTTLAFIVVEHLYCRTLVRAKTYKSWFQSAFHRIQTSSLTNANFSLYELF